MPRAVYYPAQFPQVVHVDGFLVYVLKPSVLVFGLRARLVGEIFLALATVVFLFVFDN